MEEEVGEDHLSLEVRYPGRGHRLSRELRGGQWFARSFLGGFWGLRGFRRVMGLGAAGVWTSRLGRLR